MSHAGSIQISWLATDHVDRVVLTSDEFQEVVKLVAASTGHSMLTFGRSEHVTTEKQEGIRGQDNP
jgi:hypothetical protein